MAEGDEEDEAEDDGDWQVVIPSFEDDHWGNPNRQRRQNDE